ncbi:heme lyase CcmF/NrfE family subunit [Simiduia aestuariiviva]|uniref:Cytochrome c-type biogenesis protein CcmF n=1 Tax=Simiduia aestuariiviva TaxID=1510459 RepID=A0A839UTL4_9GAMM|nr:heme lyase CcmF/NrfE family subunit [Simiduia aestuariiviva]MBB3168695.1 cytochrome c-type biogenesis protein CcmF [Simiduia aestuariiviva]
MIPELGHFALVLSLGLSLLLSVLPLSGSFNGRALWMSTAPSLATGSFVFVALAFVCLSYSFAIDDFSVAYVASNSNSLLPWYYKLSAVWGGHEGSLLLWVLILTVWTWAVALKSAHMPIEMRARVLAVMGMVAVGFLSFTLFTSNPFDRLLPGAPVEGSDLNPLLQDFGLIIHPPMLYMGYVGFSVSFAFAIATLISGRLDSAWARWSRPWTNLAWAFLTVGIALGSWWAYYELGWGGWWFWDPVENASFMPWLAGTALMHSLAVTEKRGVFKSWTLLLAIFTFSLSLLGTFLVRSGVLTSVHAFATDPERGLFILAFLLLVVGGSLTLYALRVPAVRSSVSFLGFSREWFLLSNNVLLVVVLFTVLLGTLYPLIADALGWGKLSVGPPYFNRFFIPLMGILCVLLAVGPLTQYKRTPAAKLLSNLRWPFVGALLLGVVTPLAADGPYLWQASVAVFIASWIVFAAVQDLRTKLRHRASWREGLSKLPLSFFCMHLAHLGMAVTLIGVSFVSLFNEARDVRLSPGKSLDVAGYHFELVEMRKLRGPNYLADEGLVVVTYGGEEVAVLLPQKRRYFSGGNLMTEAGIDAGLFRDVFVALGEPLDNGDWAVRVQVKPFVRWIWLGALFMGIAGLLTVWDKRYRFVTRKAAISAEAQEVPVAAP